MLYTMPDHSMYPFLHPEDVVEFTTGRPVPNGRICLVRKGKRYKVKLVVAGRVDANQQIFAFNGKTTVYYLYCYIGLK